MAKWYEKRYQETIEILENYYKNNIKNILEYLSWEQNMNYSHIRKEFNNILPEHLRTNSAMSIKRLAERVGAKLKPFDRSEHSTKLNKKRWKEDKEYVEKMSRLMKERWQDEEFREKTEKARNEVNNSKEQREKLSKLMKERWKTHPTLKKSVIARMNRLWADEEYRKKMDELNHRRWDDPEYRRIIKEAQERYYSNPEVIEERRKTAIERWKNPEYRKNILSYVLNRCDTSIELEVENILKSLNINYKKQEHIILGGMNLFPDFVVGEKKIIEVYGDFWHANPLLWDRDNIESLKKPQIENIKRDEKKHKLYKENGYELLIIWEYDVNKRLDWVKEQIKNFLNK